MRDRKTKFFIWRQVDFPNGRLFTVSSKDELQIYQDFLFGEDGKEYELVGSFPGFVLVMISSHE